MRPAEDIKSLINKLTDRTSAQMDERVLKDVLFALEESYRVLVEGGILDIVVPLGNTGSLEHKILFTENSFDILLRDEASTHFNRKFKWKLVDKSVYKDKYSYCLHIRIQKET